MFETISSLILGCVMCVAGATKIAMGKRWPVEAESMGAPRIVVPAVPWVEIVSGALLIAQWKREVIALVVASLLVAFSALIVRNLIVGNRPRCACFGTWSARPLGWGHVLRNAGLITLAIAVWW